MSALNILKRHDVIYIVTDGCWYDDDGVVLSLGAKVWPIAHFPGFVAVTGRMVAGPLLAASIPQEVSNIDELLEQIEELLPAFDQQYGDVLGEGVSTAAFGGWSAARQEMRLGHINGSANRHGEAYKLTMLDGERMVASPPLSADLRLSAHGRAQFCSVQDAMPIEQYARAQIAAQRQMTFTLPSGREGHGIGGFAQLTTVTRDSVNTQIVARFPDEVGKHVDPEQVDWKVFRSGGNDPTAGMSRLQRDAYERRQRKLNRRVA